MDIEIIFLILWLAPYKSLFLIFMLRVKLCITWCGTCVTLLEKMHYWWTVRDMNFRVCQCPTLQSTDVAKKHSPWLSSGCSNDWEASTNDWEASATHIYFSQFCMLTSPKVRVLADLIPGKDLLPGLRMATFSLCPYVTERE